MAQEPTSPPCPECARWRAEAEKQARYIEELEKARAEANRHLEELEKARAEANQHLEELEKVQAEAKRRMEEMEQAQAEANRRLEELEKALDEAIRKGKRQAAPFSRGKPKKNPKKPGRKKGHVGAKREAPEHIDHTLTAPPLTACPACGGRLEKHRQERNYEIDLPPIRPVVTCFEFESGWCPCCRKRVFSRHPQQTSTATHAAAPHLGPGLRALVADFKGHRGLPYRKIAEILAEQFGITVSAGGLALSNARLAEQAQATVAAIKQALAEEKVTTADETGWRVAAQSHWLWVVCSEAFTIYEIAAHRCATVVADLLGKTYAGILMRDGWSSYDARLSCEMLRCLLHLKRNAQKLEDAQSGEAAEAIGLFVLWLDGVFALRGRAEELSKENYQKEAEAFLGWFDEFVQEDHASESNRQFACRLAAIRHQIAPILTRPELPATNGLAERQIRPIVIHRKIAAGNKTDAGAKTLAALASLAATCRQQAVSFVQVVARILTSPVEQPVLFWQPDPAPD